MSINNVFDIGTNCFGKHEINKMGERIFFLKIIRNNELVIKMISKLFDRIQGKFIIRAGNVIP